MSAAGGLASTRSKERAAEKKPTAHAVILAGGRGTRFWPRSRMSTPKQLLNIVGSETMLAQTAGRLAPLFSGERVWVVTNREQARAVAKAAPRIPRRNILAEPTGRNTAAAIGLAAIHLLRRGSDGLMAVLPADHYIAQPARYRHIVRAALEVAARPGALVVLGIPPTHPETGFGYVERAAQTERVGGEPVYRLRRFTGEAAAGRGAAISRLRAAPSGTRGCFSGAVSTFLENSWSAICPKPTRR